MSENINIAPFVVDFSFSESYWLTWDSTVVSKTKKINGGSIDFEK